MRRSPAACAPSRPRWSARGSPKPRRESRWRGRAQGPARGDPQARALVPAQEVTQCLSHHERLVGLRQPAQLLGKERHALAPRAGHLGDVGAPEEPPRAERVEDALEIPADAAVGILVGRIRRRAGRLDRDVRAARERDERIAVHEGRGAGGAERHGEMVDQQAQSGMALGEPLHLRQVRGRGERDRDAVARRAGPEPFELAALEPGRVPRLVEDVAQAEHAGLLLPAGKVLRLLQREVAEDGEALRMALRGVDGDLVRARIPGRRLDHRRADAGTHHVVERLLLRVRHLPVRGARLAARPQVDVGVDDFHHSGTRPASLTTFAMRSYSSRTKRANSGGVVVRASAPWLAICSRISGTAMVFTVAAFRRSMMAGGVPFGAIRPYQVPEKYSGMPDSATVGTSGSAGERVAPPTASARSLPERTWGSGPCIGVKVHCASPETTASTEAPAPLYGTCVARTSARLVRRRPARWLDEATPAEAMLSSPGFAFISATSSFTEVAGNDGFTASRFWLTAKSDTGRKSASGSYGIVLYVCGATVIQAVAPTSSV